MRVNWIASASANSSRSPETAPMNRLPKKPPTAPTPMIASPSRPTREDCPLSSPRPKPKLTSFRPASLNTMSPCSCTASRAFNAMSPLTT